MLVTIDLKAHYDFEPMEGEPSAGDVQSLRAKKSLDGKWLKRCTVQRETHTQMGIPEDAIKQWIDRSGYAHTPNGRARVVAMHIEKDVMIHHAHPDHWLKVHVHDEPEVEAFLNMFFNLAQPKVTP